MIYGQRVAGRPELVRTHADEAAKAVQAFLGLLAL